MNNKILVAYFSATGRTKAAAEKLAGIIGADLYEIKPAVRYTHEDLNWRDKNSRSSIEMHDKKYRPQLADMDVNVDDYDLVLVGFPIWWYVAPTIINTFLEKHDFSDKRIAVFATSGGSGFGNTVIELKSSLPRSAVITEGRLLNGEIDEEDMKNWVDEILER